MTASRGFVDWLAAQNVALAFSTYQTGKLFLIGRSDQGRFSVYERTFERAMGLAGDDQTIYMASLFQLWKLCNVLEVGETLEDYDRYYVPQVGYTTGDLRSGDLPATGQETFPQQVRRPSRNRSGDLPASLAILVT